MDGQCHKSCPSWAPNGEKKSSGMKKNSYKIIMKRTTKDIYILKINFEYPKELNEPQSDLPFLP